MNDKFIPLSVPDLSGKEKEYVIDAIDSEWVSTAGSYVTKFESDIAKYVNVCGAVACQSGTAGLHTSLLLCGVEREDLVIVPTLTFIAAVNPVKYIGAEPIFMDCDDSLCMDPFKLKNFCEKECLFENEKLIYKKNNKTIKAIVVVHVFGNMADMDRIMQVANHFNIKVIEDATEALGTRYVSGKYKDKFAGTIADIGVYSFNGNKIITTGGGGMIVSNNKEYLKRAKHLTTQAKSDQMYFIHDEIGYNYRMTNVQAAIGIAQLEQLEKFINIKTDNYNYYKSALNKYNEVSLLDYRYDVRSNHWFYSLYIQNNDIDKVMLINYLINNNIGVRPIWGLIHDQLPYKSSITYEIDRAYHYYNKVINIPCSSNLTKKDVERVVGLIGRFIEEGKFLA